MSEYHRSYSHPRWRRQPETLQEIADEFAGRCVEMRRRRHEEYTGSVKALIQWGAPPESDDEEPFVLPESQRKARMPEKQREAERAKEFVRVKKPADPCYARTAQPQLQRKANAPQNPPCSCACHCHSRKQAQQTEAPLAVEDIDDENDCDDDSIDDTSNACHDASPPPMVVREQAIVPCPVALPSPKPATNDSSLFHHASRAAHLRHLQQQQEQEARSALLSRPPFVPYGHANTSAPDPVRFRSFNTRLPPSQVRLSANVFLRDRSLAPTRPHRPTPPQTEYRAQYSHR